MIFKLLEAAEGRWRRLNGSHLVALVRTGARFENGSWSKEANRRRTLRDWRSQYRVRAAHRCTALPSEPCVRISPHTAQATCPEDPSSPIAHGPKRVRPSAPFAESN
jgi:hypothetical protein